METAVAKILETGLLGAIIIILGIVVVFLYNELIKSKDARFNDQRENKENIFILTKDMKPLLENIYKEVIAKK